MKKRVIILAMGVLVSQLSFSNLVNDDKYRDIYGAYEGASQLSFSNFVNDGDQKNIEATKAEVVAPVQTQEEAPVSQSTESQEVNDGTVEVTTPVIAPVERIQPKTTSLTKTTVKPRKEKAKKLTLDEKLQLQSQQVERMERLLDKLEGR